MSKYRPDADQMVQTPINKGNDAGSSPATPTTTIFPLNTGFCLCLEGFSYVMDVIILKQK